MRRLKESSRGIIGKGSIRITIDYEDKAEDGALLIRLEAFVAQNFVQEERQPESLMVISLCILSEPDSETM